MVQSSLPQLLVILPRTVKASLSSDCTERCCTVVQPEVIGIPLVWHGTMEESGAVEGKCFASLRFCHRLIEDEDDDFLCKLVCT